MMKALGGLRAAVAMMVMASAAFALSFAQDEEESAILETPQEQAAEASVEQAAVEPQPEASVEQAKPEKAKKEKVKKEKPEKAKNEGKSKTAFWTAVGLDVAGAGLIAAGLYANDKVSQYVPDDNVKGAKLWASRRDMAYIAGAALLAGGITIHIVF